MGMSIDKAISHLGTYSSTMGSGQTTQEQHEDAKRVAIETMRKYQKLEQEPKTFKWCTDCKEYDQEKHCCHRWSKVIRDTVEEMKQEQEPRWIPVSERLPDIDDKVLCWYEYYHWSQEKVLPEYGLGQYFKETKAWFGEVANGKDVRVIAWQPLPKPYKADVKPHGMRNEE